jgi:apolipoprotein N-acyltransferase
MSEPEAGTNFRAVGALAPLQRGALWCAELAGWRRYAAAWLLGALATAALAPIDLTPVLVISFSGLVWLADGTTSRRGAFLLGWSFGFGFFFAGLYWIAAALFVDIAQFWWLLPFALVVFQAALAVFPALTFLVAYEMSRRLRLAGSARILALALAWVVAEYLRGHVLTGFPWILVGYAWAGEHAHPGALAVLQATSVVGIYGLSLITATAAALPARLGDLGRGRLWALLAAALLIAVPAAFGAWRLAGATHDTVPGVTLRLVQPSIPETFKNDPAEKERNFAGLLALTARPSERAVTAVIWPEAAAPLVLERRPVERQRIAAALPAGALLLTGVERGEPLVGWPPVQIWNSLEVLDGSGVVIEHYDKTHLVPFGEYMPLRGIIPIDKFVPSIGDFSIGSGRHTLSLPGLPPLSPLICYEAIFPGAAIDPSARPQWLLNVTNDAWYGVSSGPFQHLELARVRAVEEGMPLLRAANNGISAVFDSYGRELGRLGLNAVDVLDTALPAFAASTLYERVGDAMFFAMALALLAIIGISSRQGRHSTE